MNGLRRIPWALLWALAGAAGLVMAASGLVALVAAVKAQDLGERIRDDALTGEAEKGHLLRGPLR